MKESKPQDKANKSNVLVMGLFSLTFGKVISKILALIFTILCARLLGVEEFGRLGYILSVGVLLSTLPATGFPQSLLWNIQKDSNEKTFSSKVSLAVFGSAILFTITCFLAILFFKDATLIIAIIFIETLSYLFINLQLSLIKPNLVAAFQVLRNLLRALLLAFLYIQFEEEIWSMSHIVTITFLATVMVILIIECYTFSGLNVNFSHISFEGLAKLSKYSFPIIGSSLCFALMFQGDVIFLAYFHSPFETGNYYAAKRLVLPIMIIPALSKGLMIPIVAGRKVPQNIILKFILFVLGITFFITVGLILLGPWLMVFLYGDAYNSSRLLLALLGLSAFFISIKNVIVTELLGTGQSLKVFWTDFIPLPIVLFLYFYLVPDIHGEGAAYSIFTGSFISLIVSLRFIYKSKTFS